MPSAKFSSSLLQALYKIYFVLGSLMMPALMSSFLYCALSLQMPMRYCLLASSSHWLAEAMHWAPSPFDQIDPSDQYYMRLLVVSSSLSLVP